MLKCLFSGAIIWLLLSHSDVRADVISEASLWLHNKFSDKSCENLQSADLIPLSKHLNEAECAIKIDSVLGSRMGENKIAETLLFNDLASPAA
jgi:hypothetical protein